MSPTAALTRREDILAEEDDRLADFIKTLTREYANRLWRTLLLSKPHLAD